MFVQLLPQVIVPAGQLAVQAPALQNKPWAPQSLPQVPQLAPSDDVSTQLSLQAARPGPHMQLPFTQAVCAGQAWPQPPQFAAFELVSTQPLPQSAEPDGHIEQEPLLHAAPDGQALPQLPQCSFVLFR